MAKARNLHDVLSKAHAATFTGILIIFGKEDNVTHVANIRMSKGEVFGIGYGNLTGSEAAKALLGLKINHVKASRLASCGLKQREKGIPDLTRLLQLLASPGSVKVKAEIGLGAASLQTEVLRVMVGALGDRAEAKVMAIAKKHDLTKNPLGFVNECRDLVSGMFGKSQTKKCLLLFINYYLKQFNYQRVMLMEGTSTSIAITGRHFTH